MNSISTTFGTQSVPSGTQEAHLGEEIVGENAVTATEAFLAVKTMMDAGCDEIRREMLNSFKKSKTFSFLKPRSAPRKLDD